jgi:hypothetical protein
MLVTFPLKPTDPVEAAIERVAAEATERVAAAIKRAAAAATRSIAAATGQVATATEVIQQEQIITNGNTDEDLEIIEVEVEQRRIGTDAKKISDTGIGVSLLSLKSIPKSDQKKSGGVRNWNLSQRELLDISTY